MVNGVIARVFELFPAVSVITTVQSTYSPAASVLNVIVLLPTEAEVVPLEHEPPYVMLPASEAVKV